MKSRLSKLCMAGFERVRACTLGLLSQRGTTKPGIAAAELTENLCYLCNNLIMDTVASPKPNPRRGGQLPTPMYRNSSGAFLDRSANHQICIAAILKYFTVKFEDGLYIYTQVKLR